MATLPDVYGKRQTPTFGGRTMVQAPVDRNESAIGNALVGIGTEIRKAEIRKSRYTAIDFETRLETKILENRTNEETGWQNEALDVLLQLQYKKQEAESMIETALARSEDIRSSEELLNEIYRQKVAS